MNFQYVDFSKLEEISGGDDNFIVELFDMYRTILCEELEKIYDAAKSSDTTTLKNTIHKIKPNLKILGITEMLSILLKIEEAAAAGFVYPSINGELEKVKVLNEQVLEEMKMYEEQMS